MTKKVLIVDDSALMRKHLQTILEGAGFDTELAKNGDECLTKIPIFKPDAITLDINMPVMDGLDCLKIIMAKYPTPVVMFSSCTNRGALATFEALELGAVDYVPKPSGTLTTNMSESASLLIDKVASACKTRLIHPFCTRNKLKVSREKMDVEFESISARKFSRPSTKAELVVIGVSTGGPACLQEILQNIPASFPVPIVVAQHMPARFTEVFSLRLDKLCKMKVQEVAKQMKLEAGNVYIAKGDADIQIIKRAGKLLVESIPSNKEYLWHPSVSMLVSSALNVVDPKKLVCVQLTGMGNDGAAEMKLACDKGSFTIAESEQTAVVYGMPRDLVLKKGACIELPNFKIAEAIMDAVT